MDTQKPFVVENVEPRYVSIAAYHGFGERHLEEKNIYLGGYLYAICELFVQCFPSVHHQTGPMTHKLEGQSSLPPTHDYFWRVWYTMPITSLLQLDFHMQVLEADLVISGFC